jgi:hypothetical protein
LFGQDDHFWLLPHRRPDASSEQFCVPGGSGMDIALICVVVVVVLFSVWNKVHRRSLFWWRGKGGRDG